MSRATASRPLSESALRRELERAVPARRRGHGIAGVRRLDDGATVRTAVGDVRPGGPAMDPDRPFFVASVTKRFIATAILQLCEQGALTLSTRLVDMLPAELTEGLHCRDGVDRTDRITVANLLTHTSGLPDYLEDAPRGENSWYADLRHGRDRYWDTAELLARARSLEARFEPQDLTARRVRARYSDTGYQLLIEILEAVTGQPFGEVLERRILRPAGLRQTWLPGRSEPMDPTSAPAPVHDGRRVLDVPRSLVSCRDLVSTVDDLLRFEQALLDGEFFQAPQTLAGMRRDWHRIHYPLHYGQGTMRFDVSPLASPTRRRVTLVGHSGATGAFLFHCPELDLLLAGTVDQIRGRAVPFRLMIRLLRAAD